MNNKLKQASLFTHSIGEIALKTLKNMRSNRVLDKFLLILITSLALTSGVSAETFVWQNKPVFSQKTGTVTLEPVVITGTRIVWGTGYFGSEFTNSLIWGPDPYSAAALGQQLYQYMQMITFKAKALSSVCLNPAISAQAKTTTSNSDVTTRWLTAQELFNSARLSTQLYDYFMGTVAPITIIVDGKSYTGYTVYYADGFSEVWVINPGWKTSSIKLFDQPSPNSLQPPPYIQKNQFVCAS